MRIIFMGTPDFAVLSLQALAEAGHEIAAVITQPDRPKGRGRKLTAPPVKEAALEAGLKVLQPGKVKTTEFIGVLREIAPDLIAVAAFGQLLSKEILELPRFGCVNVHASLLPKYRGAAPIHWAVINGETDTGVTIMQMDEGLDSGDMIMADKVTIQPEDTTGTIHDKLAALGAQLLVKAVEAIESGKAHRVPQDHSQATYAPLLTKEVEVIDWNKSPEMVANLVRGLNPWPGSHTLLGDKVLKIWQARPCSPEAVQGAVPEPGRARAGEVLGRVPGEGFAVAAGGGCVLIGEVQLQGSRRLRAEEFMHGHDISAGRILG